MAGLRELADLCEATGLRIAFCPHVNMWIHRVEDALRVVKKVNRHQVLTAGILARCPLN